ncbi:hypothetical protein FJZ21_00710 [Candidatus Pacearchaeota archaeon]|nr:hypothetical protein [Candidatus Pacearchaeota archaeon]
MVEDEFAFQNMYREGYPIGMGSALTSSARGLDVDVEIGCIFRDDNSSLGDFAIGIKSNCPEAFAEAALRFGTVEDSYRQYSPN